VHHQTLGSNILG